MPASSPADRVNVRAGLIALVLLVIAVVPLAFADIESTFYRVWLLVSVAIALAVMYLRQRRRR
ncbi:MAG: hypothetical protein WBB00_00145 [Mycobacterium sp.]